MITLLKDDLDYYLRGWKDNQNATEAQKKIWPQNRKLPRTLLGNDLPLSLKLLVEDGGDGAPVGSVSSNTAKHYFYDGLGHIWPPDRDLVRLGKFLGLGLILTLAMVLKAQWERFFSKKKDWQSDPDGRELFEILESDLEDARKYSIEFNVGEDKMSGSEELFAMFEENVKVVTQAGYDLETFEALIHQMIMEHMHLVGTGSPELKDFITRQTKETNLLREASDDKAESFWVKKCCCIQYENDVGRLLLERENQRLENANVRQKWLVAYGKIYLPLVEAKSKYYALKRRIQLLEELGLDITLEELEKLEAEKLKEEEANLEKLREEIAFAQLPGPEGIGATAEQLADYDKEALKVLRQIWVLTHDDKVNNGHFTDRQKKDLRDYFNRVMEIRKSEKGLIRRSLPDLFDILASVKNIWENMGLDVKTESIICGDTLQEQIDWLENKIVSLERQIKDLRAEIFAMIDDKDIKEKRASMSSPKHIEKIKEQMKNRLKEWEEQIPALEQSIQKHFSMEDEGK